MGFEQIRPVDGMRFGEIPAHTPEEVTARLAAADVAARAWRRTGIEVRADLLRAVAQRLRERAEPLAGLMADEMGKPVREGRGEAEKCAWLCDWAAENGPALLDDRPAEVGSTRAFVSYQPLGVVLGIMPWNYPLWQVLRYVAPALLAGNAALLKHAPNVPGCSLALETLFRDVGAPQGLFQSLLIEVDRLPVVLDHPAVQAATLTGSTRAGRAFAAAAAERLLPTVLELGGSDAYVILEDADVEAAAATCATSRLLNGGQSCIAAKRLIVVDAVHDRFVEALVARMRERTVGDPRQESTDVGPMARADLRDAVAEQVRDTVAAGARIALGAAVPDSPGFFYPPTVLVDVPVDARTAREEVFGPAASVFRVRDEAEAVALANASDYGLGAAVFTADRARGERIAREELVAGCCFVNAFVKSDPRLPFGGVRTSGYGRELGPEGIRQFTNAKTVWVE